MEKLVRSQLKGIAGSLENPSVGAYLPLAAFSGDEKNPSIQIVGTAILSDGRIAGTFSPEGDARYFVGSWRGWKNAANSRGQQPGRNDSGCSGF